MDDSSAPPPSTDDRWRYQVSAHCRAAPSTVWPLIAEAARWKDWSFLTTTYLLREGAPGPDGVGALRKFGVGPFGSQEEVVVFEPPNHLGYEARKGIPARRYRGDIYLRPEGEGTALTWTGLVQPSRPGTGGLVLAYTRTFARLFTKELVRYADRLAGAPPR